MSALVFLYGTLMRGAANHRVLSGLGARFVGRARTAAARTLVDLGPYPALLPVDATRDRAPVEGEIHDIDDRGLEELDAFEGCPHLYRRERIALIRDDGARVEAFVYVLARPVPATAHVIPTGRYGGGGRVLEHDASEVWDDDDDVTS